MAVGRRQASPPDAAVHREAPRLADLCPMPGFGATGPVRPWNRWLVAWHALFLALVVVGTVPTLAAADTAGQRQVAVALSAGLVAWYATWMVLQQPRMVREPLARAAYLVGAGLLWAALLATDRSYGVLAVLAYAQVLGYLGRRAALVAALLVSLLLVWAGGLRGGLGADGGLEWTGTDPGHWTGPLLTLALVALLHAWVRDVARRSAERQQSVEDLRAAQDRLAAAERRAGVLQERQRLAGEIHDTLTQELAGIVMQLEAAKAARRARPDPDHLAQALRSARESLREARGLVWSLRPEALERGGLAEALGRATTELAAQGAVSARTVVTGAPRTLPTEIELALLRVAQEALSNARRHAGARDVTVTLSYMADVVVLDVRDDGTGFDPAGVREVASERGGLGLVSMRERVEAVQGTLSVESAPLDGTTVSASVPLGLQVLADAADDDQAATL